MSLLSKNPSGLSKEDLLESYGFVRLDKWDIWACRATFGVVKIALDSTGWSVRLYNVYGYIMTTRYYLSFFEAMKLAVEWLESHGDLK